MSSHCFDLNVSEKVSENCEKPYAVVIFTNESNPDKDVVSAVADIWLTPLKRNCYWPTGPNTALYIKRNEKPPGLSIPHRCKVFSVSHIDIIWIRLFRNII